ncbi:MAG: tryptophanyl-tRNA synthetase [Candidatus Nanosalina sp. J07AB43]|nr:MAG: tryptophanyl-tRNA synthetase [Candidatus Nanosalina sp. J07AB43]
MAEEEFDVTPFDVEGTVDYDRLVEKFGTEEIDEELKQRFFDLAGDENLYVKRDFIYSHRGLDKALDEYEDGDDFFLYTGIGPSGPMHIGHIVNYYFTAWIQRKFDVNVYIQITDDEKYWDRDIADEEVDENVRDNVREVAAAGFDPDKTFIFRNREYMGNMYDGIVKIAEKVNNSQVKGVFGFEGSTSIGMNFWPAIQSIPAFFEDKRCVIPAGIDQDPYWRIQRDIAEKFGHKKTAAIHSKFIPALTGPEGKMSSSKPETAIMLDDGPEEVEEKIKKHAYSGGGDTLEEHREHGADLSVDTSFQWLRNLLLDDDERMREIAEKYSSGEMMTGEIKEILIEELNQFLEEHQDRKKNADDLVEKMMYEGDLAQDMWNRNIDLRLER